MSNPMRRGLAASFVTAAVSAIVISGTVAPAEAAKVKNCGTVEVGPGNSGMTQTTTQTSACHSSSDTGESTGPVTNRGGGTPGGQQ